MAGLKVSSFNVEWMNDWFTLEGNIVRFKERFKDKGSGDFIRTTDVVEKVAETIKKIESDILVIQEGPSNIDEMSLFINEYLNNSYKSEISKDGRSQKIFMLYKDGIFDEVRKIDTIYDSWDFDKDNDYTLEKINFTRTPLELEFKINGKILNVIGLHLKSPFVNKGKEMWNDPETRNFYIAAALQNRKRVLTESIKLREYIDSTLSQNPNTVILGDMNDGPGKEYFEKYLMGMDITSELLGNVYFPKNIFKTTIESDNNYSVIFDDFVSNENNKEILLDRILVSPSITNKIVDSKVEYDIYDNVASNPDRRDGRPSDHRPVSLRLDLT